MIWQGIKFAWQTWRNKRREERWVKKMSTEVRLWDAKTSASKAAKGVALPVGVGMAVVGLLRVIFGEKWPLSAAQDIWLAGAIVTTISSAIGYFRDKKNHHGGGVFHTLTPEEQIAQSRGLAKMHDLAVANRKEKADANKSEVD